MPDLIQNCFISHHICLVCWFAKIQFNFDSKFIELKHTNSKQLVFFRNENVKPNCWTVFYGPQQPLWAMSTNKKGKTKANTQKTTLLSWTINSTSERSCDSHTSECWIKQWVLSFDAFHFIHFTPKCWFKTFDCASHLTFEFYSLLRNAKKMLECFWSVISNGFQKR